MATKLGHAYWRSLASAKPTFQEAEAAFNRLLRLHAGGRPVPAGDGAAAGLSHSFHHPALHRLRAADPNSYRASRDERLGQRQLDHRIPKWRCCFRCWPNTGTPSSCCCTADSLIMTTYLSIAKNYPNVYTDFTWTYIISPTAAKQILHQMIEMVPQTKIQGFGGDYNHVEGTYAHLKLARGIIADTLAEKIAEGAIEGEGRDAVRGPDIPGQSDRAVQAGRIAEPIRKEAADRQNNGTTRRRSQSFGCSSRGDEGGRPICGSAGLLGVVGCGGKEIGELAIGDDRSDGKGGFTMCGRVGAVRGGGRWTADPSEAASTTLR